MQAIDIREENKTPLTLNIKFMREEEGIPQKEIAKKLGVSRSTYSLWELELDPIPIKRLNDFCTRIPSGNGNRQGPSLAGWETFCAKSIVK